MQPTAAAEGAWTPRKIVAVSLCFAIIFAATMLAVYVVRNSGGDGVRAPGPAATAVTAQDLDRMLESRPLQLRMVRAFRTHYPNDYWALLERTARAGPSVPPDALFEGFRSFIDSKAEAVASAPEADLLALAAANLSTFETMQRDDVALCGQVFVSGLRPGQIPPAAIAHEIDRAAALQFQAARRGEDGGAAPRPPISEAERAIWIERMRLIDADAAALVLSGVETAPAEAQCRAAITLYRAAAELPPELAARVTADLVRSAARRG